MKYGVHMEASKVARTSLAGGVLAAIVASACCLGPLVLVTLGISGAWISNLSALEPYRPVLIGVALVFMAFAYREIFVKAAQPQACETGAFCAAPQTNRIYRVIFWVVSALVLFALAFPYFVPLFY